MWRRGRRTSRRRLRWPGACRCARARRRRSARRRREAAEARDARDQLGGGDRLQLLLPDDVASLARKDGVRREQRRFVHGPSEVARLLPARRQLRANPAGARTAHDACTRLERERRPCRALLRFGKRRPAAPQRRHVARHAAVEGVALPPPRQEVLVVRPRARQRLAQHQEELGAKRLRGRLLRRGGGAEQRGDPRQRG